MPSKPKLWMLADEDERHKVFRYEHPTKGELWVEIRFNKTTGLWTGVRTAWSAPDWERLSEEPLRNHAVAKRRAFEHLLDAAFDSVHTA